KKLSNCANSKSASSRGAARSASKKQHQDGKLTARERVGLLFDPDTFQELFLFAKHRCTMFGMGGKELPADGVVTGTGVIDGRQAFVASQDFTVSGGSVGEIHADKICQVMDMALKCGSPFVLINDSGGARIQEGIGALSGYGRIFYRNVLLSGVVPQISIIAGPCAGGAAYSPALTDFIIMVKGIGKLFITGPQVIKQVTGEQISEEELGGAYAQESQSGVVHFTADSDEDAIRLCQKLLSFLPSNNLEDPPDYGEGEIDLTEDPTLNRIIPDNPREAYDVKEVILRIIDNGDFLEVQEHYAPNAIIGFGRVNGRTVGVVSNQPMVMAGVLDINASDKISRFVRFCNAFNIPLVTLIDVPGFMPGIQQEYGGIIRHGAKMLFVYSAATVPKISIILRKAYGGAYLAMCSKDLGCDRVASWPTGEIAVMGAEGAVNIVYRNDIKNAEDPKAARTQFIQEYEEQFANPYIGAARNLIDDIIEPKDTRQYLSLALESLRNKRDTRPQKKHGLIPL
ncbi:MAG: acyl-CoA carboxylase subunit beta, partial [Chloroflexaceae bacterium]|nr:acyl-CoA carboxylase subunit beta [Chloroflexaceae bacterium]